MIDTVAPATRTLKTPARPASSSTFQWGWLAIGLVLLLACLLRLWKIHDVPGNVFYDAAVRSMAISWHNFFFGALEPSGAVSIDKPPVDLWLQVASTRVLGFDSVGLHVPEAVGGVAACGLLFGALRQPFGYATALLAALTFALLPASVLTARSDTMDSVLAALEVAALWLSWLALRSGRLRWSVAAAAVMGLAFDVKLTEMLIALPAMALLWLWAAPKGRRVRALVATGATFIVVALSWTAIASLTPLSERPFPIGSEDGSIWHVTLIYDGLNRLSSQGATGAAEGGAGPLRLFSAGPMQYWSLIGIALLATCLLALVALATILLDDPQRVRATLREPAGRLVVGIVVWFAIGLVAFSAMERLQPRYLEAFAPAVCALFGLSLSVLWKHGLAWRLSASGQTSSNVFSPGGERRQAGASDVGGQRGSRAIVAFRAVLVCFAIFLLIAALDKDSYIIERARTDSLLTDFSTPSLSRYLRAHREGARYEVASANVNDVIGLVARDGLPVLMLNSVDGSLMRTKALESQVVAGHVRFYFLTSRTCHSGRHCAGNEIWAFAHSTPVPGQSDLRRFNAS